MEQLCQLRESNREGGRPYAEESCHVLLLTLLAAVCFTVTAWADYDYIEQYGVMVTPNTEDGSLLITVKLEWTPLEELPYGQELKIGVPNGSIRDVAAQTDNIERLDFDNSYMYVYLDRGYDANETFSFAYSWVQEYMYQPWTADDS